MSASPSDRRCASACLAHALIAAWIVLGPAVAFAQHPGGVHLRLTGAALLPAAARVTESGLRILTEADLALAEAETAWQAIVDYLAGSTSSSREQFEYGIGLLLDGLQVRAPPADRPRVSSRPDR